MKMVKGKTRIVAQLFIRREEAPMVLLSEGYSNTAATDQTHLQIPLFCESL